MKKTKRKKLVRAARVRTDDKSFLIIVGGGFLLVVFILFLFGNKPFMSFSQQAAGKIMGKNVVVIKDYSFEPETMTITRGDSITWTNQDNVAHTVAATNNSFSTGSIYQGGQGSFTFSKPGEYTYYSTTYPNVRGKVIVE